MNCPDCDIPLVGNLTTVGANYYCPICKILIRIKDDVEAKRINGRWRVIKNAKEKER